MGLLGDDSFRPCVWRAGLMASSECAVTRDGTSCKNLDGSQSVLVTEVRSYPQYDGAPIQYVEVADQMCFHIACWGAIGWQWGTTHVGLGITYIYFVPKWFPVIRMGKKYQHKIYLCQSYYLKTIQIQEKPCRFCSWMETEWQILIKRGTACNQGFLYWAGPFDAARGNHCKQ